MGLFTLSVLVLYGELKVPFEPGKPPTGASAETAVAATTMATAADFILSERVVCW